MSLDKKILRTYMVFRLELKNLEKIHGVKFRLMIEEEVEPIVSISIDGVEAEQIRFAGDGDPYTFTIGNVGPSSVFDATGRVRRLNNSQFEEQVLNVLTQVVVTLLIKYDRMQYYARPNEIASELTEGQVSAWLIKECPDSIDYNVAFVSCGINRDSGIIACQFHRCRNDLVSVQKLFDLAVILNMPYSTLVESIRNHTEQ